MPHSSGGGSSSGSSHSSSSGSGTHVNHHYFQGASRYIRYKKSGEYEYVYSDRPISLLSKGINYLGLICFLPLLALALYLTISGFSPADKIDTSSYDSVIFFDNSGGYITNQERLGAKLNEFQDLTGITVCIETRNDGYKIDDLENYAYDEYLKLFDDEKHWLLVYVGNPSTNKWAWEGMQGNDTDDILTESFTKTFTKTVQKELNLGKSFDDAIITGLDKISPKIMSTPQYTLIFGGLVVLALIIFCAYEFCIKGRTGNQTRYIKVSDDVSMQAIRCKTCKRTYHKALTKVCPYCYNVDRFKFDPFYRKKVKDELGMNDKKDKKTK